MLSALDFDLVLHGGWLVAHGARRRIPRIAAVWEVLEETIAQLT